MTERKSTDVRRPRKNYVRAADKPNPFARLGVHAGFLFLKLLPQSLRDRIARRFGPRLLEKRWRRKQIVDVNLKTCFPEMNDADRGELKREFAFRFLRIALDLGDLWWGSSKSLLANIDFEGAEHLDAVRAANRPVILLGPHTIGLDIGGLALCCRWPVLGLTSEAKSGLADWAFLRLRSRYCDRVIDRTVSVRRMIREVQGGRVLFYLPDEDHGHLKKSVFVPFFGKPTSTMLGAGRLLALAKAEVLPFTTVFDAKTGRYVVKIFPPIADISSEAEHNCFVIRRELEKLVRIQPEDYLWTLRIFNNQPDGKANPEYPAPTIPLEEGER
ncbi:MAG TPA: hypothetical protein VF275_06275 [Gammaproteobacteria bacterium]